MSIQTTMGIESVLKNHNTRDWVKPAEVDFDSQFKLEGLSSTSLPTKNLSFGEMLAQSISEVNGLQVEANKAIQRLATGQTQDVESTLLAVEKAENAFKLMNKVRSKVIEAYKEVMRMQV